jgi:hypothetical protein
MLDEIGPECWRSSDANRIARAATFAGGFLGLDNIGVFDRSQPLPTGGHLEQRALDGGLLPLAVEVLDADTIAGLPDFKRRMGTGCYLLAEALQRYHPLYGDALQVACPTGSGRKANLEEVTRELSQRLAGLLLPSADGRRPSHGEEPRFAADPHWKELLVFPEYFHGDTGRGFGARLQVGTTLVVRCLEDLA